MSNNDDSLLVFAEDAPEDDRSGHPGQQWKVLIVDDDREIHAVTTLALSDLVIQNHSLDFFHAYSGEDAREMLRQHDDFAVVLLDVVMETDNAGLDIVRFMREELNQDETRIILRTGQPGYAPEDRIIQIYDINDYKTKTELTRSRLVTSIVTAIRSYRQLRLLRQSRVGLEKIIQSSANLMEQHAMANFAEGVLTQLASILGITPEGILCAKHAAVSEGVELDDEAHDQNEIVVLGAAGHFAQFTNCPIATISAPKIESLIVRCLEQQEHLFERDASVLFIQSGKHDAAVYIETIAPLSHVDRNLLKIFLTNIGVGYENVTLFNRLRKAAYKDELTNLPNRTEFIRLLDAQAAQNNSELLAGLIDIDHFSDINDSLGEDAGNLVLKAVAKRIHSHLGEDCQVARLNSDVFGVIGNRSKISPANLQLIFDQPFVAGENALPLKAKFGLCGNLHEAENGSTILRRAWVALNQAKKSLQVRYTYFEASYENLTRERLDMIRELRADFEAGRLEVWYQPQVSMQDGTVNGMEALLRWPKDDGYISPAVFVPLAEYSGLIVEIGAWVLDQACGMIAELNAKGMSDSRVSVNVSMHQFRSPSFTDQVKEIMLGHNIRPSQLELEITESVVMDDPKSVTSTLNYLKASGLTIAIDDFGTGFSSLSYLQKLPLDCIKIDRSFITQLTSSEAAPIAEMIIALAQKLDMVTVSEGVETQQQAEALRRLGCTTAQGFLYAKPMPKSQLFAFLA